VEEEDVGVSIASFVVQFQQMVGSGDGWSWAALNPICIPTSRDIGRRALFPSAHVQASHPNAQTVHCARLRSRRFFSFFFRAACSSRVLWASFGVSMRGPSPRWGRAGRLHGWRRLPAGSPTQSILVRLPGQIRPRKQPSKNRMDDVRYWRSHPSGLATHNAVNSSVRFTQPSRHPTGLEKPCVENGYSPSISFHSHRNLIALSGVPVRVVIAVTPPSRIAVSTRLLFI